MRKACNCTRYITFIDSCLIILLIISLLNCISIWLSWTTPLSLYSTMCCRLDLGACPWHLLHGAFHSAVTWPYFNPAAKYVFVIHTHTHTHTHNFTGKL